MHHPCKKTSLLLRIIVVFNVLYLLTGCSWGTKYVLVTDRSDVNFEDGDRFISA